MDLGNKCNSAHRVPGRIAWPHGHKFAFTVVDDTDLATVQNVKPVYDLLADIGLKTTKTVWMAPANGIRSNCGDTCQNRRYLDWLLNLQQQGFEIAWHNAAPATSNRQTTEKALGDFQKLFGRHHILFSNHSGCRENMYWGEARMSGWHRPFYNLVTCGRRNDISRGHVVGDPLFWGDLCQKYIRFVRNFVFDEINALNVCPELPYHDAARPFVNFWFPSCDGSSLRLFLRNFTERHFERLVAEGGCCIAYVHFGAGFSNGCGIGREFQKRMEKLASLNGWFAPASDILEYLRGGEGIKERTIAPARLNQLERAWLFEKMFKGTS